MKRYQFRVTLFVMLGFSILTALLYTSFFIINDNFFKDKSTDQLLLIGESMNTHLSQTIKSDYDIASNYINLYKDNQTPLEDMVLNKESLNLNGMTPDFFGLKTSTSVLINGETYLFTDVYDETTYFRMPVSIYPINTVLLDYPSETNYLVFSIEDYMVFFEAKSYMETIFNHESYSSYESYLISLDGYIFISSNDSYSSDKFGNPFLLDTERNEFFQSLRVKTHGIYETTYLNEVSFITYHQIDYNSLEKVFLVNVFIHDDVLGSNQSLVRTLLLIFVVSIILFIGFLLLGYKLVEMKLSDIENSRFKYYYDKPLMIKITKHGRIINKNRSFKEVIKNHQSFQSIRDFILVEENVNPLDIVKRQKVLSIRFDDGKSSIYLRFVPLKTTFGYLLVADNYTNLELKYQSYRSIAHFNQVSKLPNINHLKYDLAQYLNDKEKQSNKNALVVFSMINFSNYIKLLGENVVNQMILNIRNVTIEQLKDKKAFLYNLYQDHFAIFFNEVKSYEDLKPFAENLKELLEKTIDVGENKYILDFRFGIFNIEHENYISLNEDEIYDNAMLALSKSKSSMTNKIVTYDITLGQFVNKKEQMEKDLVKAIENDEFVMFLQPQYSTTKDKICGFEALIRWDNPKYSSTSPEEYISLAESNNLIIDIGKKIMHQTFKMAKELEPYDVSISMNISPVQMLQAGFTTEFIEIYQQYELKPNSISVEVTETFLMTSFELIIEKLKILQRFGVSIHLDDFGTGYSSLLYLKELPIDSIKIDRQFITYAVTDKYSKAIINMIINLAKNLDLEVIAEGVEDDKQYQLLKKSGCDIIQGYFIGKGMRFNDAKVLLTEFSLDKLTKKKEVK